MADVHDARWAELGDEFGGDRVRGLFRELMRRALQELRPHRPQWPWQGGEHQPPAPTSRRL